MSYWQHMETLDIIEALADWEGEISSEEALSEKFDKEVMPSILEMYGLPGIAFEDTDMINEEFNNWTDGLREEGTIHNEQYQKYSYVGGWT